MAATSGSDISFNKTLKRFLVTLEFWERDDYASIAPPWSERYQRRFPGAGRLGRPDRHRIGRPGGSLPAWWSLAKGEDRCTHSIWRLLPDWRSPPS